MKNSVAVTLIQQDPITLQIWNVSVMETSQLKEIYLDSKDHKWQVDCDLDTFIQFAPSPNGSKHNIMKNQSEIEKWIESTFELFHQEGFLIPVVAQDKKGKILMQAWANKTALLSAVQSGCGTYFSRSRNKLWIKGEESGHFQKNLEWEVLQSDIVSLIYHTDQIGAACHTGEYTCFFREFKRWDDPSLMKL